MPVAVGRLLDVKVRYLAAQMREVGITRRLVAREVAGWLVHPASAPRWFAPALEAAQVAQHEATQPARPQRPTEEHDHELDTASGQDAHLAQFLAELRAAKPARRR